MMEPTFGPVQTPVDEEEGLKRFHGVMVAQVIRVDDPLFLGRVRVRLRSIDCLDLAPWARVAVPMAGLAHGHYFLPNIGDEVLVAFESGDLDHPYIIGSLWHAFAPPPLPSPLMQTRMIRTPVGNQIAFTELPPTIIINTPTGYAIVMSPDGIKITAGPSIIALTPASITLTSPAVVVKAGSFAVDADAIGLQSHLGTDINGGPSLTVKGGQVTINEPGP